jgi:multidrug efflux system membrane fusion protein
MEQPFKPLHYPIAAMALAVLAACGRAPETAAAPQAPKVSVAQVLDQPVNEWDEFTGRLEAPETVQIRPRVSGQVDQVAFTEGALVKKGDLLFQIDPRPFQAQVNRLEAQLQQARANAANSQNEASRGERLRSANAISAELADLDLARLNLSFTRVLAPISGRVGRAEITAGNLVSADSSLLTRVLSTDKVYAYFDADERAFLKYSQLARDGHVAAAAPVYMGLSNEEGTTHLGQLNFLDNQVNPQTGTIQGRAVFDNRNGEYTPGLYARLKLVASGVYEAVLIKDEAVGTDLGKKFVLVMDQDNKATYRSVELGPKLEGLRIVRSGLAKGDRIVVNGLQRVRPGATVDPQTVPMASNETLAALARQRQALEANNPPAAAAQQKLASTPAPRG